MCFPHHVPRDTFTVAIFIAPISGAVILVDKAKDTSDLCQNTSSKKDTAAPMATGQQRCVPGHPPSVPCERTWSRASW